MARSGLLEQAKQRRYRLSISPGDSSELSFEIIVDDAPLAGTHSSESVPEDPGDDGAPQGLRAHRPRDAEAGSAAAAADEDPEVRAEIENLVAGRHIPREAVELRRGEGRTGITLPIVVNVLLALIVAGALYTVTTLFNTREEAIALDTAEVLSTESRIIQQLIRDSEEELSRREAEISAIESQLSDLAESKAALEEGLDQEIARREAELRATLDAELQSERERLEALGTSEGTIAEQLEALEAARSRDVESELAAFRSEVESEFQSRIAEVEADSTALEEELSAERAELEAQIADAREAATTAEARLSTLEREQSVITLFQDQLAAAYERIFRALRADDYDAARTALDRVDEVFRIPTFAGVSAIQARREIDRRIADTIGDLIDQEERSAGQQAALESELAEIEGDAIAAREELLARRQEEIRVLEDRVAELTASVGEAQSLSGELEGEVAELGADLAEVRGERDEARAAGASLREANASLRREIETLEAEIAGLRVEVADLQGESATLRSGRDDLERELAVARDEIRRRGIALREAQAELADTNARILEIDAELASLTATRRRQSEHIAELETQIAQELRQPEPSAAAGAGAVESEASAGSAPVAASPEREDPPGLQRELLGVVTSAPEGGEIVIRSLLAGSAGEGDHVQIRRRSVDGRDTLIAEGRILNVESGVVTVEVRSRYNGVVRRADAAFVVGTNGGVPTSGGVPTNGGRSAASSAELP